MRHQRPLSPLLLAAALLAVLLVGCNGVGIEIGSFSLRLLFTILCARFLVLLLTARGAVGCSQTSHQVGGSVVLNEPPSRLLSCASLHRFLPFALSFLPCSAAVFPHCCLLFISADKEHSCFSAKNLALAGVKSLTLCDPKPIAICELSSQFYFTEADVGKNRAEVPLFYHFTCLFLPEAFLSHSDENI